MPRIKKLEVSSVVLEDFLRDPSGPWPDLVTQNGFPTDGNIVSAEWDAWGKRIILAVESESFDEIKAGDPVPDLKVLFSRQHIPWLEPCESVASGGQSGA